MGQESVIVQLRMLGSAAMRREARQAGEALAGMGRSAGRAEATGLNRIYRGSRALAGGLATIVSVGARAGAVIAAVGVAGGTMIARSGIPLLKTLDRQRLAFETFTGSAQKAAEIMRQVQKLAIDSPALSPETAGAGVQALMSYGIGAKQAIELTRALGDSATASGQDVGEAMARGALAIGQISAKGKLSTEELNQLGESVRVNRKLVARELGMTGQELEDALKRGEITAARAIPAIRRAMQAQSKGASQKFSQLTEGRFSKLQEIWATKSANFLRPFYDQAGIVAAGLSKRLEKINFARLGKRLAGLVTQVVGMVSRIDWGAIIAGAVRFGRIALSAGRDLLEAFKPAAPFLKNVLFPILKGLAAGIITAIVVAFRIAVPVIRFFSRALGWIGEKARPLAPWLERLGMLISFLFPGSVLRAVRVFGRGVGVTGGIVGKAGSVIATAARVAFTPFRLLIKVFQAAGRAGRWLGKVFLGAAGLVSKSWRAATGRLSGWLSSIGQWFQRLWDKIKPIVDKIVAAAERVTAIMGALNPFDSASMTPQETEDLLRKNPAFRQIAGAGGTPVVGSTTGTTADARDTGPRRSPKSSKQFAVVENHNVLTLDGRVLHRSVVAKEARLLEVR